MKRRLSIAFFNFVGNQYNFGALNTKSSCDFNKSADFDQNFKDFFKILLTTSV
jgi:hypothetical protein